MMKRILIPIVLCGLILPAPAAAQATRADSLTALVETLLAGFPFGGSERPTLHLASLPPSIPEDLRLPATVEIAGSLEFSMLSMTLLRADDPSAAVWDIRRQLEESGWTYKAADVRAGFSMTPASTSAAVCSDAGFLGIGASESEPHLFLVHMLEKEMSPCADTSTSRDQEGRMVSPVPQLSPPPGVNFLGGGGGGSGDHWYSSTRLSTDLDVQSIMDHYIWELQRTGVQVGESTAIDAGAVANVALHDSANTLWRGFIGTLIVSDDVRVIVIHLMR